MGQGATTDGTREREKEGGGMEFGGTGILFEEPNPNRFIQEGNRKPVSKATHARYREGPVRPRVRQ